MLFANTQIVWRVLLLGYCLFVAIELPIFLLALSARNDRRQRIFSALWLTACSFPLVILVMPAFIDMFVPKDWHGPVNTMQIALITPIVECLLFWMLTRPLDEPNSPQVSQAEWIHDLFVIVFANVLSFFAWWYIVESPTIKNWTHPPEQIETTPKTKSSAQGTPA
jgi:hypothetical protein